MAKGKKSQANDIERAARVEKVLNLRRAGFSIRHIANQVGVAIATVHSDIQEGLAAAIAENVNNAEELRAMELERLDSYLARLSPMIFPNAPAKGLPPPDPDLRAIDKALKIGEQRAKLLGLYMPDKQEHSGEVKTIIEFVFPE